MAISSAGSVNYNQLLGLKEPSNGEELNQTDFLNLLVTQLQQQDPLNPMDSSQFSAQLAQFSSLEQLIGINESMTTLSDAQFALGQLSAMSLIGKQVTFQDTLVTVIDGDAGNIDFELGSESASTTVRIFSPTGEEVKTIELGPLAGGPQTYEWDGTNSFGNPLPNGTYTFEVSAENAGGSPVQVTTKTTFMVEGVEFVNGETLLRVNGTLIPLTSIIAVSNPAATPVNTNNPAPPAAPEPDDSEEKSLASLLRWIGIQ